MTARRPWTTGRDEDYPGHPREMSWRFGHCNKCDVVTWPVAWCNLADPSLWWWEIRQFRDRVKDSWDDYRRGDSLQWIWRFRWRH